MTQNAWKWLAALTLGAFGGFVEVATDAKTFPGWWDLIRHMVIGIGTVIPALKMTLFPAKD